MKTVIIAEAGVNHNGDINLAKKLIEIASKAGADYVKFQTFNTESLVSKHAEKAEYQKKVTQANESQYEMIKKLEFDKQTHLELKNCCKNNNIKFLSTAFDLDSIDLLSKIGVDFFKIPSGEITNYPYIRKIARLGKPIVMSTGMANLLEIEQALDVLLHNGLKKDAITILHCNTEYPTPMRDVNLKAMLTIKNAFNVNIGYSDHTLGIEIPIAAVALGAAVIEKHFTLDRSLKGPDHKASLEPDELADMVKCIRNIEIALGNGIKNPSDSELKNIDIVRKFIVAKTTIKIDDVFSENNITVKRSGKGISPMRWNEIIGKVAPKNYYPDDIIEV